MAEAMKWLDPNHARELTPIADHDPGDEAPRIRIQHFGTMFGSHETCGACGTVNDAMNIYKPCGLRRCRACQSELREPIVLREFTRAELYGR